MQVEVLNHPSNDAQLLIVLLSELGFVGLDDVKEFRDDRGDSTKMARPERSTQMVTKTRDFNKRPLIGDVNILNFRREDEIRSHPPADIKVLLDRPRISQVVLSGAELKRVHEDADDNEIGAGASLLQSGWHDRRAALPSWEQDQFSFCPRRTGARCSRTSPTVRSNDKAHFLGRPLRKASGPDFVDVSASGAHDSVRKLSILTNKGRNSKVVEPNAS